MVVAALVVVQLHFVVVVVVGWSLRERNVNESTRDDESELISISEAEFSL